MPRRFILPLLALFIAAPVFAQQQPQPGNDRGGDRGGDRGSDRGGDRGRGGFDPARMAEFMKDRIGASDDEWKVIQPKLEKVVTTRRDAMGGMGGFFRRRDDNNSSTESRSPVQQASQDLRTLLDNKDASAEQIAAKLLALREARDKARQELVVAQKDLKEVLSARQEAVMVMMGMLD